MASPERISRIRRSPIPPDAVLVVRGDELIDDALRHDALNFFRRFRDWGMYGISASHATDAAEVDVLCQTKLIRFKTVVVFRLADVEALGIAVVGTFRTPHVTLAHADLEELVRLLQSCPNEALSNPYNED